MQPNPAPAEDAEVVRIKALAEAVAKADEAHTAACADRSNPNRNSDIGSARWRCEEAQSDLYTACHSGVLRLIARIESDAKRIEELRQFIEDRVGSLRNWWSFDEAQQHTHSWHSREDYIELWNREYAALRPNPHAGKESK